MYGTVMIAKAKASPDEIRASAERWAKERGPSVGYIDEWLMAADDGRIVMAVRFESKDAYLALADDSAQDEWWQREIVPMLDGEPDWIDGQWVAT